MKALVVDDNVVDLIITKSILIHLGFSVDATSDASEALGHFKTTRYDLVVTDYQMPLTNGVHLASSIRLIEISEKRMPVPIYVVSANTNDELRSFFKNSKVDCFLSKPISITKIREPLNARFNLSAA